MKENSPQAYACGGGDVSPSNCTRLTVYPFLKITQDEGRPFAIAHWDEGRKRIGEKRRVGFRMYENKKQTLMDPIKVKQTVTPVKTGVQNGEVL